MILCIKINGKHRESNNNNCCQIRSYIFYSPVARTKNVIAYKKNIIAYLTTITVVHFQNRSSRKRNSVQQHFVLQFPLNFVYRFPRSRSLRISTHNKTKK